MLITFISIATCLCPTLRKEGRDSFNNFTAPISVPGSKFIRAIQVGSGFDVADDYIVQHANAEDLVVTADLPLAAECVEIVAGNSGGEADEFSNLFWSIMTRWNQNQKQASILIERKPCVYFHC